LHWLRVTVSDSKITANVPNGWDGSDPTGGAGFNRGETEDWLLQWHYSRHEDVPPNDPNNPPGPIPLPECNKAGTIYQVGPLPHRGHSGSFEVGLKNTGDHPIHIVEGPFVTGPYGDAIDIDLESLVCTIIQPGEEVRAGGTWDFDNPAPNKAWCDFEAVGDPDGQYVIYANVGDYISPTSDEATGGIFEEVPELTPDLECDGSLSWTDVKPGGVVTGSFTVKNVGDPGSLLNWKIESYPPWGSWSFSPSSGTNLKPEDGSVTVSVTVGVPDEEEASFSGDVKVVNQDDSSDTCTIPVSLTTPKSRSFESWFSLFLHRLVVRVPWLEWLLYL
jgi:hypothetical protein